MLLISTCKWHYENLIVFWGIWSCHGQCSFWARLLVGQWPISHKFSGPFKVFVGATSCISVEVLWVLVRKFEQPLTNLLLLLCFLQMSQNMKLFFSSFDNHVNFLYPTFLEFMIIYLFRRFQQLFAWTSRLWIMGLGPERPKTKKAAYQKEEYQKGLTKKATKRTKKAKKWTKKALNLLLLFYVSNYKQIHVYTSKWNKS